MYPRWYLQYPPLRNTASGGFFFKGSFFCAVITRGTCSTTPPPLWRMSCNPIPTPKKYITRGRYPLQVKTTSSSTNKARTLSTQVGQYRNTWRPTRTRRNHTYLVSYEVLRHASPIAVDVTRLSPRCLGAGAPTAY